MNVVQRALIFIVRLYQWMLSPLKNLIFGAAGSCRFTPTCSSYAIGAIREHGAMAGSWLACRRILRCHPWGGCGEDPVPPSMRRKTARESPLGGDRISRVLGAAPR